LYLRMSTDLQNPRSPAQQEETIRTAIKRAGYSWVVVATFTDAGVSGRFTAKRTGFQDMVRQIRTGALVVDAIVVDTYERYGRSADAAALRAELAEFYGVLVLTTDSGFTDPTSTAGQALSAVEAIRSTENGRVKAHNVLCGKRDAARNKAWPGGVAPFGYRLESVLVDRHSRREVDHSVLVPDPATAWIVKRVFALAADQG
jgi:site-specific DNA recombinase